jgi:hypothetical protein
MENKPKTTIVILSESLIASWLKDIGSFLMFGGLMYFNHKVLDGNGWIDFLFIIFIFMWLTTLKSSQVFKGNKDDAVKWLQDKE